MPVALRDPMLGLLRHVAADMPRARRVACTHLGLFGPLVARRLARSSATNATVRTTMAVTTVAAGTKDNVLPDTARATVDVRILPGDRVEDILAHVRRVVADPAVQVRGLHVVEPSPVAPSGGVGFEVLAATVRAVFPEATVAPGLVVAGTDSRHYAPLSAAVYRFRPVRLRPGDLGRIHGVDERIAVEDYARLVTFYARFLHAASWGGLEGAGREASPAA